MKPIYLGMIITLCIMFLAFYGNDCSKNKDYCKNNHQGHSNRDTNDKNSNHENNDSNNTNDNSISNQHPDPSLVLQRDMKRFPCKEFSGNFYTCDNKKIMQYSNLADGICSCKTKFAEKYSIPPFWKQEIQKVVNKFYSPSGVNYDTNTLTIPRIKIEDDFIGMGLKHEITLDMIEDILSNDMILLVAQDAHALFGLLETLIEQNIVGTKRGFPDFYYIPGPVLVLEKRKEDVYYMIDYPIKYIPSKFPNFVNKNSNPYQLKEIITRALRLIPDGVFLILKKVD